MQDIVRTSDRRQRRFALAASFVAFFAVSLSSASAQQQFAKTTAAVEIANEIGGELTSQIHKVALLRQTAQPVRVTGNVCYSTCTLYIGLPEACVSPRTEFGFHGPSSYGKPLEPSVFEHASQLIAAHYPEPIRDWYLETARYEIRQLYKVKGAVLINLGVPACED